MTERKTTTRKKKASEPTPVAEMSVEEKREERAELLEEAREADAAATEAAVEEAEAAGLHEAKLDDAGAAEQQRAARENDPLLRLDEFEGPPVVAPILEKAKGKIEIVRLDQAKADKDAEFRMGELFNVWVRGTGWPQGEVIVDVRRETVGDHARFSTWVSNEDGAFAVVLPGIQGPGTWLVHAEHLTTTVGEGREDHLPQIQESKPIEIEVTA